MSDRYLIGTGSRNTNDTANWSDTDGGSGGFSVPTSADNVFKTANSGTGTITVNANFDCLAFTCSGSNAILFSSSVYTFSVYGAFTREANTTFSFTGTAYMYFKATTSVNVTMGGTSGCAFNRLYFDGVGGTWTNQDEMNVGTSEIRQGNGTWDQNGKNITTTGRWITDSGTKTLTPNSSYFKVGIWSDSTPTGFTFNSSSGTVEITNGSSVSLTGSNTFYNLKLTGTSAITSGILLLSNIVVNNVLTIAGVNSTTAREVVASSVIGTPRTITCSGTVSATNCDFRDITGAGIASWNLSAITGGSGDCGGNSGITFTTAVKQYFKHTSGAVSFNDTSKWFSDFSPRTTVGRVPLPQDDWDMDADSFTGTSTVTVNCPRIGKSCNMEGVNQAVTWSLANNIEVYGSYILGTNITPSGSSQIYFFGEGSININTYNKTLSSLLRLVRGSITLLSNLTTTSNIYPYSTCILFDANDFNVTCSIATIAVNYAQTCYMGNGIWTLTSVNSGDVWYNIATTIYCEGSTIVLNPASGSADLKFNGGGKIYNKVQFSGSHTGNFDITGSNTIAELIVDSGRKVRFTAGTTQAINKMTIGDNVTWNGVTDAQFTINYTGSTPVQMKFANIRNMIVLQKNKIWAGASVNNGNNVNVMFAFLGKALNYLSTTRLINTVRALPLTTAKIITTVKAGRTTMI